MENQETNTNQAPQAELKEQAAGVFERIKGILFSPKTEWEKIGNEKADQNKLLVGYVIPLALIPFIFTVLGYGLIGKRINLGFLGSYTYKSWELGLSSGLTSLIVTIAGVFLTALVINMLATNFKAQQNYPKAFQLVAYAYTPMWIAGVFNFIPAISFLAALVGIYGLYQLYVGLEFTMKPPKEKQSGYFWVSLAVMIVMYIVLTLVLGLILAAIFTPSMPKFGY